MTEISGKSLSKLSPSRKLKKSFDNVAQEEKEIEDIKKNRFLLLDF